MADSLMYQEDMFVLLVPGAEEEILTPAELLEKLKRVLRDRQDDLPREVAKYATVDAQAHYLRENACDLELQPGKLMQWYAIRLEK